MWRSTRLSRTPVSPALALLLLAALAAAPAVAQETFGETTEVLEVQVPVHVTLDGAPVRGLTEDNFKLYDGRSRRKLVDFEVVDLSIAPAGRHAAGEPIAARRHFLLLFDLAFSEPASIVKSRRAAAELVAEGLHPSDLVAVATYTVSQGPRLLLGFTSDRYQALAAIASLGVPELHDRTGDPLGVMVSVLDAEERNLKLQLQRLGPADPEPGFGQGRNARGELTLLAIESMRDIGARNEQALRRNEVERVRDLSRSMSDLAGLMAAVGGRKHVVYLSEGFAGGLIVGEQPGDRTVEDRLAAERGESYRIDTQEIYGDSEGLNELERMLDAMRRADCLIHSVDIGGARAGADVRARASGAEALVAMARSTGGGYYANYNDLTAAMGQLLDTTSVTYLLTFEPKNVAFDGSYHRLKVELDDAPRGARVEHRPGYYAPKPLYQRNAFEERLQTSQRILAGVEGGSLQLTALATPLPPSDEEMADEDSYVPLIIDLDGPSLLADTPDGLVPLELYAYAIDSEGGFRDYLFQHLELDLRRIAGPLSRGGLRFFGSLDLPAGVYSLRVLLRNGLSGAYALRLIELEVPGASDRPTLLPPLFVDRGEGWLVVQQSGAGAGRTPHPFQVAGEPFVPAAMPRLVVGGDAELHLMTYRLEGDLTVEGEVLGLDGKRVDGGRLQVASSAGGLPGAAYYGGRQLAAHFAAAGLEPGRYRLAVTVRDSRGASGRSTIPIEIVAPPEDTGGE